MASSFPDPAAVAQLTLPWERDYFLRSLVQELASVLEEVVGLDEATGFISVVGQRIGLQFNRDYKAALGVPRLTRAQVAAVLVDLKRRIQGDFFVVAQDDEKIVLGNRACPFAEKVLGHPSMCMMTSNVFGGIAAENLGYAKVVLEETIAQGAPGCRVTIYLQPTPEAEAQPGREYIQGDESHDA
jgi:predicted ArsR family transcriptional regulator